MSVCFFVRCKPEGADLVELVRRHKRVFLGYAPFKEYEAFTPSNVRATVYDLSVEEPGRLDLCFLKTARAEKSYRRQVSMNANLIREVVRDQGALVVVPRPESGLFLLGKVLRFKLVDNPPWLPEYKSLRETQRSHLEKAGKDVWSDERVHACDIVQTFVVDDFRSIPLFAFPAWIRHQCFSRATLGRIRPKIKGHDPHSVLTEILHSPTRSVDVSYTADVDVIQERLLNFATPNVLEHLFCELLQLDNPGQHWWHVGGVGDGGVDALGFNCAGEIVGAAQCKLSAASKDKMIRLGEEMSAHFLDGPKLQMFVCSLYADVEQVRHKNVRVYGGRGVAALLLRHKQQSVFARMLGLCPEGTIRTQGTH